MRNILKWLIGKNPKPALPSEAKLKSASDSPKQADPGTIDTLYQEYRDRARLQLDQVDAIDRKAGFGIATASLLLTPLAGLRNHAYPNGMASTEVWSFRYTTVHATTLVNWTSIVAIGIVVAVIFCSFMGYKVRGFMVPPSSEDSKGKELDMLLALDAQAVKEAFINSRAKCNLPKNEDEIRRKLKWTQTGMVLTVFEGVALLAIAVMTTYL